MSTSKVHHSKLYRVAKENSFCEVGSIVRARERPHDEANLIGLELVIGNTTTYWKNTYGKHDKTGPLWLDEIEPI